uniref:Uncharacterized protein n=1 Tax=Anthurium amnicola TaxID=1678845 RepID=A0A1D1YEK1_9ARAE
MMRQSPSRNNRSRGWKLKHVLQICLLVAVCLWLLYQVKHSHDKKKALEEGNLKVSDTVEESRPDFLKLTRKDLQGNTVVTATDNTAHKEEEENEEAEEAADEENKQEENEDEEGRGAGDDEIDESDQERADDEADGGEEFGDEDDKEGQSEDVHLLENGGHEDDDEKSQEAREEHYKADDASSAVVRDTQEIVQENENVGAGNLDVDQKENAEKVELENDGGTNDTQLASKEDGTHDVSSNGENQLNKTISLNKAAVREREQHEIESPSNSTVVVEPTGDFEENSIPTSNSSDHVEQQNNRIIIEPNNQTKEQTDSTATVHDEQTQAQNVSTGKTAETGDSTPENVTANTDSTQDRSTVNETGTPTEENSFSENILVEQTEKSKMTGGIDESDESHNTSSVTNGDGDAVQGEAIANSLTDVSTVTEDEREARTDLSTLPDIQIDMRKEEDIAAE